MSEAAVATPVSEGAPSEGESNSLFGVDQGALLKAMGLPNRSGSSDRQAKPEPEPETRGEGEGEEFVFEFAGQKYTGKTEAEARGKAEHAFKTHRGQAQAAARELARVKQQASKPPTTQPQPQAAPATPAAKVTAPAAPSKDDGKAEDGNLIGLTDADWTHIQKLRAENRHDLADVLLLDAYEKALKGIKGKSAEEFGRLKAEMKEELEALRKPEQERQAQQQKFNAVVDAFHDRGELLDDNGDPIYSELKSDEGLEEVIDTWERMVNPVADYPALPADFAITPAGVHVAYCVRFFEKYGDLVRAAVDAGYDEKGRLKYAPSPTPSPSTPPQSRGRLQAPVALPAPAPRRAPAVPRGPEQSFKDMLTSKANSDLI